jgi:hypothetical protein
MGHDLDCTTHSTYWMSVYRALMAGRTGGCGRGGLSDLQDCKRQSESAYDEDGLDHSASSPLKRDK